MTVMTTTEYTNTQHMVVDLACRDLQQAIIDQSSALLLRDKGLMDHAERDLVKAQVKLRAAVADMRQALDRLEERD